MAEILTGGGVSSLLKETSEAIQLQVLELTSNETGTKRYRCKLWDGELQQDALFSPDFTREVDEAGLQNLGVVSVQEFNLVKLQDKTSVNVLKGSVVEAAMETKILSVSSPATQEKVQKRMSYPSPPSEAKPSSMRTSANTRRIQPIGALNPYAPNWTIKARVTNKGDVRSFSGRDGTSGKVSSVDLMDEDGSEIRATMWHDLVDKYMDVFQVGKMYYISKGRLKVANKQYSAGDYDMTISEQTEVEQVGDDEMAASPMKLSYNFVPFDALAANIGSKSPFDVIGVVQQTGDVATVKRKADGTDLYRREITLIDSTSKSVRLTVWNQLAQEVLKDLPEQVARGTVVLAIKGVKASDYDGVSLSTMGRSMVCLDPVNEPAADRLRQWYDCEGGKAAPSVSAGAGLASERSPGGQGGSGQVTSLKDMQPAELAPASAPAEFFSARATVTRFSNKGSMWYPGCPEVGCQKKVVQEGGGWYCEAHQQAFPNCNYRYIAQAQMMDSTGSAWVALFNEGMETIMGGKTADEMVALREEDEAKFNRVLKQATFQPFCLRLKSKTDEYGGETRRRLTASTVQPMNWSSESKRLLKAIESMS